jgi:Trp operon repressor
MGCSLKIRLKNLLTLWLAMVLGLSLSAYEQRAEVLLCSEYEGSLKGLDFFEDYLAFQLILMPSVEVGECRAPTKSFEYLLKQRIKKMPATDEGERLLVLMSLTNREQEVIWSKVEMVSNLKRKEMVQRAKSFAEEIAASIQAPKKTFDPFLVLEQQPATDEPLAVVPNDPSLRASSKITPHFRHVLGVNMGLATKTQFQMNSFFGEHREKIASKPFLIVGMNYHHLINKLKLGTELTGSWADTEIRRPMATAHDAGRMSIRSFDINGQIEWALYQKPWAEAGLGFEAGYYYFAARLQNPHELILLSRYHSTRQGLIASTLTHFELFASSLLLTAGYFPLVQQFNQSHGTLENYGWKAGVMVQSALYKSFLLKLTILHSGESFSDPASVDGRIVRYQNLAYMGLVARI